MKWREFIALIGEVEAESAVCGACAAVRLDSGVTRLMLRIRL
jgi:hypothetical protein